jgi:hypothetical protein
VCPRSRDCRSDTNRCGNYSYGSGQRRGSRRNACRGQQAPRDDDHHGAPNYDQHHNSPAYNDDQYQHDHDQHYHDQHYHDDGAASRRAV